MTKATQTIPKGYKQTEIGVIPEDWDVKKLGEIAEIYQPETISQDKFSNEGFLVYGANGIVGKYKKYNHEKWQTIITCRGSTCGTVNKTIEKCWITGNAMVMNVDSNKNIDKLFFYYLLTKQDFRNCITGSGQPQIVRNPLFEFVVDVPSDKKEQTAIATALSDTDALIKKLEKLIVKKKAIKQGAMQQLLTGKKRLPGFSGEWDKKPMQEIGKTYGGLSGKVKADFGNGNSSYIPFMNIMSNPIIDITYFDKVNIKTNETQAKAQKNDLFFNGSSETPEEVGMCSVLLNEIPNLYLNSFCFGFRLNKDLETDGLWLSYFFRSSIGRELIYSLAQGATRYNLSKTNFLKLIIPYPEPEEQTAIATVLSDIDAEIEKLENKLNKYRQVKTGMMQQLLTGKIRLI